MRPASRPPPPPQKRGTSPNKNGFDPEEGDNVDEHLQQKEHSGDEGVETVGYAAGSGLAAANDKKHRVLDMHDAARKGDVRTIKRLLLFGNKYANQKDGNGIALLHRAASNGHVDICRMLLDAGAEIDIRDHFLETPLKKAVFSHQSRVVMLLIQKKANLNAADQRGKTALHYAAERGQLDLLNVLIGAAADVNVKMEDFHTPLHLAAINGHVQLCKRLIDAGARTNEFGGQRRSTALHLASANGHVETAELLLAEGADADLKDDQHRTPLVLAKGGAMRDTLQRAFTKGRVDPKSCKAEGDGIAPTIIACDSVSFEIQPCDYYCEPVADFGGWLDFAATLTLVEEQGESLLPVEEDQPCKFSPDKKRGIHICTYNPRRVGSYKLEVVLAGAPINGSPFPVTILPSIPHPLFTQVAGEGVEKCTAGLPAEFFLHTRDQFGNVIAECAVDVRFNGSFAPKNLTVAQEKEGVVKIGYLGPETAGNVEMTLRAPGFNNIALAGSPYSLWVMPDKP